MIAEVDGRFQEDEPVVSKAMPPSVSCQRIDFQRFPPAFDGGENFV